MGLAGNKRTMEDLAKVITRFYGNVLVLKIWPFQNLDDCTFACRLKEEFLRDSIADLTYKFGATPSEPWVLVGQMARITQPVDSQAPSPGGVKDDIEKGIEQMFDAARFFFNVGSVKYPYTSVTPLAVYRE